MALRVCICCYRLFNAVSEFKKTPFLFPRRLMVSCFLFLLTNLVSVGCFVLCRQESLADNINLSVAFLWMPARNSSLGSLYLYVSMYPFCFVWNSNLPQKKAPIHFNSCHALLHRLSFLNTKICVLAILRPFASIQPDFNDLQNLEAKSNLLKLWVLCVFGAELWFYIIASFPWSPSWVRCV